MSDKIVIRFDDLDIGSHSFDFEVDNEFFKKFDHHDFLSCNLKIAINLIKDERNLTLITSINGAAEVECDRCLDPLTLPIGLNETFFVKESENDSDDDNVINVSKDDIEIDLSNQIFDIVVLSLPMQKIHPNDENGESTCNANQIMFMTSEEKEDEEIDPRWEALKNLKK